MKISVPKNNNIETILFSMLLLLTIFNDEKYGTIFRKVYILVFLFMATSLVRSNILSRSKKYLVYGFIWCFSFCLSTLFFYDSESNELQTLIVVCIFIVFLCVFLGVSFDQRQIKAILVLYILCVIFMSINIIMNYVTGNFYRSGRTSFEVFGTYKDPNYVSSLIAPVVFIVAVELFKKGRFWYKLILFIIDVLLLVAIEMTGSRAAFVALLLGVGIYIILQLLDTSIKMIYKVIIIFVVIILATGASAFFIDSASRLTDFSSYSNNIRLTIWSDALEFWSSSPIIGKGVSSVSNYTMTCWYGYATHNCFLDIIGDSGLLGLFCLILILKDIINSKDDKKKNITFAVICLVPQAFINGFYAFNFWLVLCLIKLYSDFLGGKEISALKRNHLRVLSIYLKSP